MASSVVNFPAYGKTRRLCVCVCVDYGLTVTSAVLARYGRAKKRGSTGVQTSRLPSAKQNCSMKCLILQIKLYIHSLVDQTNVLDAHTGK